MSRGEWVAYDEGMRQVVRRTDENGIEFTPEQYAAAGYRFEALPPTFADVENDIFSAFADYLIWNAPAGWPQSVPAALAHPQAAYLAAEFANNTGHAGIEAAGVVGARLGLDRRAVEAEQAKRLGIQQATAGGGFLSDVGELLSVQGPLGITAGMALAIAGGYAAWQGGAFGASAGASEAVATGAFDTAGWAGTGIQGFDPLLAAEVAGTGAFDATGWEGTKITGFDPATPFVPAPTVNAQNVPTPPRPGVTVNTPPAVNVPPTPGPLDTVKGAIATINQVKSAAGAIAAAMGVGGAVGANPANVRPVQTVRPLANTGAGADTAANVLPLAALAAALLFLKG